MKIRKGWFAFISLMALVAIAAMACASATPDGRTATAAPAARADGVAAESATEPAEGDELAAAEGAIVRLDPRAAPTAQRVTLRLDPAQHTYQGSVDIDLTISEAMPAVLFHAEGQTLDAVTLAGADGEVEVEVLREDQGLVRLRHSGDFAPGEYRLSMDFSQEFNTKAVGLYRSEYNEVAYLFTQLQAIDARKAFPCWDEPQYKIPYQLTITAPEGQVVVTNTPPVSTESADGWTQTQFAATPPTPSYLLAIAVGPFEVLAVDGLSIPARILAVEGFAELGRLAAEMTPPILTALEEYFDRDYPYQKLDQIAVPEFWPGAMENPGLITYADRILLLEEDASSRQRRRLAQVMAHEFAHMWFGDLVTMQWWDDLWLNESFAAWMENKIPQQLYPDLRAGLSGRTATQDVMAADARPSSRAVRGDVVTSHDIFADIGVIYEKGAGVLTMVEQWLGADAFRDGVRLYMDRHAWANATADDFWAALSEASGEDVASILAGYVLQPGLPLVAVEQRDGLWWLTQQRFHAVGVEVESQLWKIPATLSYSNGDEVLTQAVLLTESEMPLELPAEVAWVLPDAGARGYYRWTIPGEQLQSLAADAGRALSPRERASVLDNAAALLVADLIDGADYVELLESFAADADPDVLSQVLDGIERVGRSFVDDANRDRFAAYVRAVLQPMADRLGWQRVDGEIETTHGLRRRVFELLGVDGRDPEVRELARQMTERILADPATVDPDMASRALRIAAIDGDEELFNAYQERFEQPQSPRDRGLFLGAMAQFSNPELRLRVREYGLSEAVKPTEMFAAYGGDHTDAQAMTTLQWILDNYDGFEAKVSKEFLGFMPRMASGCSREQLQVATEFFSEPEHQVPGTLDNLRRVREQVNECQALRRREGEAVSAYLEQFAG